MQLDIIKINISIGGSVVLTLGELLELPEAKIYHTDGEEVRCIYLSISAGTKIPVNRILFLLITKDQPS